MKRKLKIFTALLLTFVFVLSIVGCGGSKTTTDTETSTATGNANESSSPEPVQKAPEPVTINIMTEMNTGITVPGEQDDQVAKEIERLTGITMNIENVEGTMITQKVLAMNASGDLPDLFVYDSDKDVFKTLLDSDSVLDVTDLAESKLTNWMKNEKLKGILDFSKQFLSEGTGKLYNIPLGNGNGNSPSSLTAGTFIRWDYYKELGYPKVSSIYDLIPVLKQMQDKHPTTKEGKKAYGVSFWVDWGIWPVSVFGFVDGYAEGTNFGGVDISNDEFVDYLRDDSIFWKYSRFYNKAYQAGILDPDSFTIKQQDWANKVVAGQTYFMITGWMTHDYKGEPNEGFALVDTTGDSNKCYGAWMSMIGCPYAISKKTEHPDRVLDLLNFFGSDEGIKMLTNGVQDQVWDLVDGKGVFKEDVLKILDDPNNAEGAKYGYGKYGAMAALNGGEKDSSGLFYNFKYYPEFIAKDMTEMEKDQTKFYGITLPSDLYNKKQYTQYGNVIVSAVPTINDPDYINKEGNVSKYFEDNWLKLITAKDDAAFEAEKAKFIADVKAMGYDDILAKYVKAFEETKAKVGSIR